MGDKIGGLQRSRGRGRAARRPGRTQPTRGRKLQSKNRTASRGAGPGLQAAAAQRAASGELRAGGVHCWGSNIVPRQPLLPPPAQFHQGASPAGRQNEKSSSTECKCEQRWLAVSGELHPMQCWSLSSCLQDAPAAQAQCNSSLAPTTWSANQRLLSQHPLLCSPVRKSVSVQSVKVTMSSFTSQCARARDSGAGPRIFLLRAGTRGFGRAGRHEAQGSSHSR